jgi:hypothetical protein
MEALFSLKKNIIPGRFMIAIRVYHPCPHSCSVNLPEIKGKIVVL